MPWGGSDYYIWHLVEEVTLTPRGRESDLHPGDQCGVSAAATMVAP